MTEGMDSNCYGRWIVFENTAEAEVGASVKKNSRHTYSSLAGYTYANYKFGMMGVGKAYAPLITAASADHNHSDKKVKVN